MTKKEDKILEELEEELSELEEKEQLETEELEEQKWVVEQAKIEELEKENKVLTKKLDEMKMILANTQHQYMDLKTDFDRFQTRMENDVVSRKNQIKIDFFKKALPVFDDIFQGLENTPDTIIEDKWYEWFSLVWKNIQNFLSAYDIKIIPTVWVELDENMHEAISAIPGKEEDKWKVIQEIKKWYYMEVEGIKKVILPAKVIISG